jgi:hypothetical protein
MVLGRSRACGRRRVRADVEGVSSDGSRLYVAAFGSIKVRIFDIGDLDSNALVPSPLAHRPVTAGGPSGARAERPEARLIGTP